MKKIKIELKDIRRDYAVMDKETRREARETLKLTYANDNMTYYYYPEDNSITCCPPFCDDIEGEDYLVCSVASVGYKYLNLNVIKNTDNSKKTMKIALNDLCKDYDNSNSYDRKIARNMLSSNFVDGDVYYYYPEDNYLGTTPPYDEDIEGEDFFRVTIEKIGYKYVTIKVLNQQSETETVKTIIKFKKGKSYVAGKGIGKERLTIERRTEKTVWFPFCSSSCRIKVENGVETFEYKGYPFTQTFRADRPARNQNKGAKQ
jgi:hypothetical protein